jgi:adenylate cyclase
LIGDEAHAKSAPFVTWNEAQTAMLSAYRAQNWDKCKAAINVCREASAGKIDGYYRLIELRVSDFITSPPPPDWDGVHVAESK